MLNDWLFHPKCWGCSSCYVPIVSICQKMYWFACFCGGRLVAVRGQEEQRPSSDRPSSLRQVRNPGWMIEKRGRCVRRSLRRRLLILRVPPSFGNHYRHQRQYPCPDFSLSQYPSPWPNRWSRLRGSLHCHYYIPDSTHPYLSQFLFSSLMRSHFLHLNSTNLPKQIFLN